MIETRFLRRDHVVLNAADKSIFETHPSISRAKKWSHDYQKANGGLGCGVVAVIRPKPKVKAKK